MKKNLRYLCTLLLMAVAGVAWGQKVTLDFTTQDWKLPTESTQMNGNTYSSGGYTITFNSGKAYQATQNSGGVITYYLLMGKSGASMSLPAFDFNVSKIVITGRSSASTAVKQNVFVKDVAVSTETTGATGTNTYEIAEGYRTAGTIYTLKVNSAHNTQITKIDIYEDDGSVVDLKDPELSFTPTSVNAVYGEPFTVPTLSTAEGFDGSIAYSSSNSDVATVKNSGEVTLVGAGETTITATSAPTKTFKTGTASYTLTVTVNEETEGVTYIKVTADDQVVVGKRFILVNEDKNVANTLLGSNPYLGNVAITITDSKIVTEKAAPITLGRTSTGYSLKTSEGYINSVAARKLSNSEEEVAIWNIVSTDDGYVVRGVDAETLGTIQYNASSPRFLNYTTNQQPAVLYVESDGGDTPIPDSKTVNIPYKVDFTEGQDKFKIENTTLPEGLNYVWSQSSSYGMKASAYVSKTNYASESWLVSPLVDLSENTGKANLTFEHAVNFFSSIDKANEEATVWVREEGKEEWSQLTINYPENLSWTFVQGGPIDLSRYNGKKIQIGFKYVSTDEKAGTWEIKNFNIFATESVPVNEHRKGTYVTSNALDFTGITTVTAYVATAQNGSDVTFDPVTTVPAGTPLLVKGETTDVPVIASATAPAVNMLVAGTGAAVASEAGGKYNFILNYLNGAVGFYRAAENTVAADRAYLSLDSNIPTGAKVNLIFSDEEATGINNVNAVENTNEKVFNLAGQQMKSAVKGVYIKNGKKYVK